MLIFPMRLQLFVLVDLELPALKLHLNCYHTLHKCIYCLSRTYMGIVLSSLHSQLVLVNINGLLKTLCYISLFRVAENNNHFCFTYCLYLFSLLQLLLIVSFFSPYSDSLKPLVYYLQLVL